MLQSLNSHASPKNTGSIAGQASQTHAAGCGQNNSSNKKQTPKFSKMEFFPWVKSHNTLLFFYSLEIYSAGIPPDSGGLGVEGRAGRTGPYNWHREAWAQEARCRPGLSHPKAQGPSTGQCPPQGPVREQAPHGSSHQGLVDQLRWGRRGRWTG